MEIGIEGAVPSALRDAAVQAAALVSPSNYPTPPRLIEESYARAWGPITVDGETLRIPFRHFQGPGTAAADPHVEQVRQAWLSRSADGFVRQSAIQALLADPQPWHVPYVVELCGEYVIEISRDILDYAEGALAEDPRMLDAYQTFWRDNPAFVQLTCARAASYWDAYFRGRSTLANCAGYAALQRIESLVVRRLRS